MRQTEENISGPRLKVSEKDTKGNDITSTFPIKIKDKEIDTNKIIYGSKLGHDECKKQLKVARAVIGYAYDEFYAVYKDPSSKNTLAFNSKIKEFSNMPYNEQKKYMKK